MTIYVDRSAQTSLDTKLIGAEVVTYHFVEGENAFRLSLSNGLQVLIEAEVTQGTIGIKVSSWTAH